MLALLGRTSRAGRSAQGEMAHTAREESRKEVEQAAAANSGCGRADVLAGPGCQGGRLHGGQPRPEGLTGCALPQSLLPICILLEPGMGSRQLRTQLCHACLSCIAVWANRDTPNSSLGLYRCTGLGSGC